MFVQTLLRVFTMLLYAVPGFLLIKTQAVKIESIPAFAKLLVYVCAPCLTIYSFSRATYTPGITKILLITFAICLVLFILFLSLFWMILRKRFEDVRWRVFTVTTALGNVGFFGIPLLEHVLPQYPNAIIFSEIMSLAMNLVAWTYGLFLISRDKKFIRPLKIVTVPSVIAMALAYPLFITQFQLPVLLTDCVSLLGRMSTPLCMLIVGMRLATVPVKALVTDWRSILVSAVKMILFPLCVMGVMLLLPVEPYVRAALFLLACCPCASIILSLSEIIGQGQKSAANAILISTLLSVFTIPLMVQCFLQFIL